MTYVAIFLLGAFVTHVGHTIRLRRMAAMMDEHSRVAEEQAIALGAGQPDMRRETLRVLVSRSE